MTKIDMEGVGDLIKRSLSVYDREGADRLFFYGIRYLSWKLRFHSLVRSLPDPVRTSVFEFIRCLLRKLVWVLHKQYPDKYTDADPYKYIYVDPSEIEYTTGEIFSKRRGWVVDGEWDLDGNRYMDRTFASAIEQRFIEGLDWEETVLADKYEGQKFEKRCAAIERLYGNIRENGYKSQRQLLEEDPEAAWDGLNDAMHPLANEVAVDIGRNGELLWNICGQHRLAIAKILDIDRIPVQVFRRHATWQDRRNAMKGEEQLPESVRDHPDLQDVLND